jgi:hypothetical protein
VLVTQVFTCTHDATGCVITTTARRTGRVTVRVTVRIGHTPVSQSAASPKDTDWGVVVVNPNVISVPSALEYPNTSAITTPTIDFIL